MFRYPRHGLAGAVVLGAVLTSTWSTALMSQQAQPRSSVRANPLLTKSPLPFEAPPFDRIQDGDFASAFEAGMKHQLEEIAAIAESPAAPTFENTLVALEKSGQLLERVRLVFNGLTSANTNPALQKTQQDVAPKLAAHEDAIFLNAKLFNRVDAIYGRRDGLNLDPESSRLVEYYHRRFVRSGARLSDADKAKLKALNEQDAALSAQYISLLLAAAKAGALVVGDAAELAGLSKDELETAALAAKARGLDGKWLIPLLNTTQQPMLASLENRATREALFRASWTRTERGDANDTRQVIATLAAPAGPQGRTARAIRTSRPGCSRTRWRRRPPPSSSSWRGSSRRRPRMPAPRRATSRRSSTGSTATSRWSRGTGTSTRSRSARPSTISTAPRSRRTSNWTACSATACSTRRRHSTA